MKKLILTFLIGSLVFACSKKDDPTPQSPDQLLVRTWVLNALTSTDPDFQSSGQLLLGSEWTFKGDKTFSLKASVSGIDLTFTGSWSLAADEQTLTVTSNYGGTPVTSDMTILSVTAAQLVLEESVDGMTNTYTFSAKP